MLEEKIFSLEPWDYSQFEYVWFWQVLKPSVKHRFILKKSALKEIAKNPNIANLVSIDEYRTRQDKIVVADFIFDFDARVDKLTQKATVEDIEAVRQDVILLYDHLINYFPPEALEIYFSGRRGFAIIIPKEALGVNPSEKINFYFKQIILKINDKLGIEADSGIYGDGKLIRVPNSRHDVSGLYRICLRQEELHNLTAREILELAKKPREFIHAYPPEEIHLATEGIHYFQKIASTIIYVDYKQVTDISQDVKNLSENPTCIQDLLEHGIKAAGERNQACMVLATFFKDKGLTLPETIANCKEWGKKIPDSLTGTFGAKRDYSIISCVKSIYEPTQKEYKFHCACARALTNILCNKEICPLFTKQELALYRRIPGLGTLREGKSGYEAFDAEAATWEQINNFLILYDRIVQSEEDISYEGRLLVNGSQEFPFVWGPDILADAQRFRSELVRLGATGVYYSPKDLQGILMLASYFGTKAEKVKGLENIGIHGETFVTKNFYINDGKIEANIDHPIINHKTDVSKYDFYSMPLEDCPKVVNFILEHLINLHSRNITLPLLGEIGRCPLIHKIGNMRYISYTEGVTGSGKSLTEKAFLNFYFPISLEEKKTEFKQQAFATMSDTANRIEFHGYFLIDVPFVWDDFKSGLVNNPKTVIQVIQNYYNQGGRGRMTREIKERKTYYIRANLWANGEQLPDGHASALERCLVYRTRKKDLNLKFLDVVEKDRELLRGLTPWYIAWTQKNEPQMWTGDFSIAHPRLVPYGRQNLTGLKTFLSFLHDHKWITEARKQELLDENKKAVENAISLTKIGSEAESSVNSFVEGLRELLVSEKCILVYSDEVSVGDRAKTKEIIGEIPSDNNSVYIFPSKAVEQVTKLYSNKFRFSTHSLGRDLLEEGYLDDKRSENHPSVVKRLSKGVAAVWSFSKKKLLEGDTEEKIISSNLNLKDESGELFDPGKGN